MNPTLQRFKAAALAAVLALSLAACSPAPPKDITEPAAPESSSLVVEDTSSSSVSEEEPNATSAPASPGEDATSAAVSVTAEPASAAPVSAAPVQTVTVEKTDRYGNRKVLGEITEPEAARWVAELVDGAEDVSARSITLLDGGTQVILTFSGGRTLELSAGRIGDVEYTILLDKTTSLHYAADASALGELCDLAVLSSAPALAELWSWDGADSTYHLITDAALRDSIYTILATFETPYRQSDADADPSAQIGFLTITEAGEKQAWYVTEEQLYTKAGGLLKSEQEQRTRLLELARRGNEAYLAVPQWLAYMSPARLTKVSYGGGNAMLTEEVTLQTTDRGCMDSLAAFLRRLEVRPGLTKRATRSSTNPDISADAIHMTLTFDSGVVYHIQIQGNERLIITSSDMVEELTYILSEPSQLPELRALAADFAGCPEDADDDGHENPLTAKPVIYLYPEQPTDVSVKLDFHGELTATLPAYNGGWEVTAYPDGRLVDKASGAEYDYLFWEGNSGTDWRFDEGFCVAGADVEAFLREKAAFLGLSPREAGEFVDFWSPEMSRNAWNLVTFSTAQYEALAPLTISPAPDSLLRVHMVYKAMDAPVDIPAQELRPFTRKGFTVVEWGGSRCARQDARG